MTQSKTYKLPYGMRSIGGEIIRARIVSSGLGYTSDPQVIVHGDGDGNAAATATINEFGVVIDVVMTDYGSGYTYASFELIGGTADPQSSNLSSLVQTVWF